MSTLAEDQIICGKRGGRSFLEAIRPASNDRCPDLTVPCSNNTSPENTYCVYPDEKQAGLCPVTEIKIMSEDELGGIDTSVYVVQRFRSDEWLVYSKD